ncbi:MULTISPECIES: recombination regulator RecX [Achromobacter]|uniref:Regulatory protein RecX n=1 Tax=Achromobacter spanius TaxID=217203 RepID=A0ABY8GUA1_9BURK|nr:MULTISPECIES: recombination regulator RecX [Achromobacter]WAI82654.1 recombination regulator RecX [Achromobacter spanius]WEX92740.1 recombination regulator RecX [Achromobacter sp. SS2-2022]WFP08108.1 recombination regulator RecX [Achromobacter spanius]
MSWKPTPASADRLRAKLDDEFETVAKPEGLRRSSDARREREAAAPAVEPDTWQRSSERRGNARGGSRIGAASGRAADRASSAEDEATAQDGGKPARKGPSLKMRAVGYLSRREHAREELARKLAAYAEDADEIESVLDALEKEGWLSTERFAQSLVHRRASRQGAARIVQELRQHGVDDTQVAELREQLRATEYDRALEVWKKRFDAKPEDRAAYAKQARFLASRGFAHDVIRRILGEGEDD